MVIAFSQYTSLGAYYSLFNVTFKGMDCHVMPHIILFLKLDSSAALARSDLR